MIIVLANILVGLVILLHVSLPVLEMFLWDQPLGRRISGDARESASASKIPAMHQGLYNGLLAAGLVRGLSQGAAGNPVKTMFPVCEVIAGISAGLAASRRILLVQALAAAATLAVAPCS